MKALPTIILLAFISFSCSKENVNKSNAELILGRWDVINVVAKNKTTNETQTKVMIQGSYMEFSSDGTLIAQSDQDDSGEVTEDEKEVYSYTIENNNLRLDSGGPDETTILIKTLTASSLVLVSTIDDYEETFNLKK